MSSGKSIFKCKYSSSTSIFDGLIKSLNGVDGSLDRILSQSSFVKATGWPPFPFLLGHVVISDLINRLRVRSEKPGLSIGTIIHLLPLISLSPHCILPVL